MTSVRAVFFDFGGVFTDSPFRAVAEFAGTVGGTPEQVTAIVFGGYGEDGDHPWHRAERGEITLEQMRADILDLGRAQGLHVDLWEVFGAMGRDGGGLRTELVDHVRVLRASGLGTAIITNNLRELKDHWRGMLPVDELFDHVVDSSEVGIRKPNPAIFEHALALTGLAAEEVVFLDDFAGNVEAARALGMRALLVDGDGPATVAALTDLLG